MIITYKLKNSNKNFEETKAKQRQNNKNQYKTF